jgi:hypothetical protein
MYRNKVFPENRSSVENVSDIRNRCSNIKIFKNNIIMLGFSNKCKCFAVLLFVNQLTVLVWHSPQTT